MIKFHLLGKSLIGFKFKKVTLNQSIERKGPVKAAISKKEQSLEWLKGHPIEKWGQCVYCQSPLSLRGTRLLCHEQHSFDMSKQGYFNFTTKKLSETKYDKALFAARRQVIMTTDFYLPVYQLIANQIVKVGAKKVIDAGSGEGSHMMRIQSLIPKSLSIIGMDLAKAGVMMATDYNGHQLALVSDLSKMPLQSESVDLIISFLSPANYDEFKRVLKPSGWIVKVIPNVGYLQEIRELLEDLSYSNQPVIQAFEKHFRPVAEHHVFQTISLDPEQSSAVMQMTPLIWRMGEHQRAAYSRHLDTLTLDVTVLMGQRSST